MKERYARNSGTISKSEQELLKTKSVCVIGCGGLGGGVIEGLTRLGVGRLTIVDKDVFDETNLNRQVLSNENNLGVSKAEEGARQMYEINSEVKITPVNSELTADNCIEIIGGHDVVVDAVDNIAARRILEDACEKADIPLVHGAIAGWYGQISVVMPGSRIMHELYQENDTSDKENPLGNPSFTPAVVSAMEVAETLKLLLGQQSVIQNKLLSIDIMNHQYDVIDFD